MNKTFQEVIAGIRTAIYGREVREDIAQGMEYVETFAATATQKASAAAASADAAKTAQTASKASEQAAAKSAAEAGAKASTDKTLSIENAPADAKVTGDVTSWIHSMLITGQVQYHIATDQGGFICTSDGDGLVATKQLQFL